VVAVNIRYDEYDVRVDRKSKWGNPFVIGRDGDRSEVIAKHKAHLWGRIKSGEVTLEELADLHDKRLGCWCAPCDCHGDTLTAAAAWAAAELKKQQSPE
jgi:hypothetical protein